MESAFMSRGHNHINARLLAAQGALDGGNDMHPGESGTLDLVFPADRITGGGEDHLEVILHVRILFPHPDGRVDHDLRNTG